MEWQPIETAPKDGTRVFLGVEERGFEYVWVGSFDRYSAHGLGGCFRQCDGIEGCQEDILVDPSPTVWLPIPDLPQTKGNQS